MAAIPALLPAAVYVLLILVLVKKPTYEAWVDALVKSHLLFFCLIAVSTEIISAFDSLDLSALLFVWILFGLTSLTVFFFVGRRRKSIFLIPAPHNLSPQAIFLLGSIGLLLLATLITAFIYPPNTWDSMTYHMSRVAHWISNKSVSFYPTAITRQNYQMPLAEFAIAHLQILSNSDVFANMVQWVSFVVLICLAALLAAEFGFNRRLQLLSAFMVATLPMAILQSTSTQNDLVVSGFIMSFALYMLRLEKNFTLHHIGFASLALGLALLTKGTAFIYCTAIGILLSIPLMLKAGLNLRDQARVIAGLTVIIILAVALNSGHFWRNYKLYGNPFSREGELYWNETMSARNLISNLVRNFALHLGTPSPYINRLTYRATQLALGKDLNNAATTFRGQKFLIPYGPHEDVAGNFFHLFGGGLGLVAVFINYRRSNSRLKRYALSLIFGIVLYCGLFKWQPWASRLHTPLFVMAAPLIAAAIDPGTRGARKYLGYTVVVLMFGISCYFAFANYSRPLMSAQWVQKERVQLYFQNRPWLFQSYPGAMQRLAKAKARDVGLSMDWDDWEYPFWVFGGLNGHPDRSIRLRHVGISNISRTTSADGSLPEYVISTRNDTRWTATQGYQTVYRSPHVTILKKAKPE